MLAGQEYHLIQKFHLFRTHVFLKEKEWQLKGDITSHNYEIYSPLETVATIQQKWFSFGNCCYLKCQNSADSLLSLCTVLTVDTIEKLRQK